MMIQGKRWFTIGLAIVGIGALITIGGLINRWQPPVDPLPGWQIIRPPHEVSALAEQDEIIWAGGQDGVFALHRADGTLTNQLEPGFDLDYVRALLVDRDGTLWIAHQNGLTSYDGSAWHTYTEEEGLPDNRVNALMLDREGRLWAGTWGGAAIRTSRGWESLTAKDGLLDDMVNVMLQDHEGGIWFGSYVAPRGGVSYLINGTWQHFSTEEGLPHNNVNTLFQDSSGTVWIGTGLLERGGAAQLERTASGWTIARILTQEDGLAGNKVRSIFQDRGGGLWFGSEYDGLAHFDGGTWRIFTETDGLAAAEVKVMLQDTDDTLWLGTTDGITRISATALASVESKP